MYEDAIDVYDKLYGYEDGDAVEEAYEEMYGEDSFKLAFKQEKVAEFIYKNCKVVEPKTTDSSETVTE